MIIIMITSKYATVVDDAIRFVSQKSRVNFHSSSSDEGQRIKRA
jgi:hypothetical protein